jgi:RNA-directed DNA polymerase
VRYADDFVILCKERPEFYLEQAKQVLDRLGLTLNAKKTRILNADAEPFDFLGHRFMVRPSKRTGKRNTFYYPSPKAMKSVKKKIREVVHKGQHWNLPELIKERINPILRGWGNFLQEGQLKEAFPEHRQLHDVGTLHHAAEEAQETVKGMEGPSAVMVLRLSGLVQAV